MTSFKKTDIDLYKNHQLKPPETLYWKKLGASVWLKEFGPIDYISFAQADPQYFAVTSSARVQIYDAITKQPYKNLNQFKQTAYGGSLRNDGKLLCAGSEDGVVRLFDVSTRNILRRLKGHTAAVHRVYFTSGNHVASFSDDKSVKIWDIAVEREITQFQEHADYIRSGCTSPCEPNILLSGGYDNAVKMYDVRCSAAIFTLDHEAPVESTLFTPSGSIFVTAGGVEVRIWDAFTRTLLARCTQYHKTVTCMCAASNGKRLITASLDKRVKVLDMSSYKVVHNMTYTNPLLSVAISSNDDIVVTGSVNGLLSVQKRGDGKEISGGEGRKKDKIPHHRYLNDISVVDMVVAPVGMDKMARYEFALRKFEYRRALECLLGQNFPFKSPAVLVALFDELIRRKGLKRAVCARDSKQLAIILRFLIRYLHIRKFTKILVEVADSLIDSYADIIESFPINIKVLFGNLSKVVKKQTETAEDLLRLQGALEMIFASSNLHKHPQKVFRAL